MTDIIHDYIVYTDGAYSRKHNEGAFAYVICNSKKEIVKKFSSKIVDETNNRAELKAIIAALYNLPEGAKYVKVVSDSQYALNTLFSGWARNANKDLFDVFDRIMDGLDVVVDHEWVKGHSGNEMNELCDAMYNDALGYDPSEEYIRYKKR